MRSFYFHEDNILFLLSSAHWKLHGVLTKKFMAEKLPVTPDQWLIMLNLLNHGSMYQNELAKSQSKDKSAIKRLIDHLEEHQLVKRNKSKSDLRKKKISLSPKGKNIVKKLNRITQATFKKACKGLTEVELNALKRLLLKIEV